ncbi:hypothetical protein [Spirosoma oryzicola]|uniref:hypothetical protein n=1 Tax=Spirosoma oryzicola TaxID=2898794 RepID=UPI001E5ECC1C|nr:hypothetical protein [Spirosoma oryzicola]UHG93253.1 hypothetical protein LQ777_10210 [Spirosoma oryzicola]
MPNSINNFPDNSIDQHLSRVLSDWVEAICQLQYWNTLLQRAIEEKTSTHYLITNATKTQLVEHIQLKQRIGCGLSDFGKEMGVTTDETNHLLGSLKLIEHTQIVLDWCLSIQQQLGR